MSDSKDNMIVFCRIGWMKEYKGLKSDSIKGGGVWVDEHGWGGEIFNFLQTSKYAYGYVQPPPIYGDAKINLGRIANLAAGNELDGVKVIWFANRPGAGQVIIGWYENATAYRKIQNPSNERKIDISDKLPANAYEFSGQYYFKAGTQDITLLPVSERRFRVPRQKFFSGQSNTWYADSDQPEVRKYVQEVSDYIENYSPGYEPKSRYFIKGPLPEIPAQNIRANRKELDELSELEVSLQRDPNNFDLIKKMAGLLIDEGYSNKAIEYIDKALKLNDSDWELHYWLAICEENKGNYKRSIEIMEIAIPLAFKDSDKAEITNTIGCMHDNLGDFKLALENFDQATKLVESESLYHHNKGQMLYRLERYNEAIASLLRANELEQNDEETLNWLGIVYEEIKDYSNAIHYYSMAISCDSNITYAIEYLAKLYENLGMFSKARDTWRHMKRGDRLLKKAEKALKRLTGKADKPTINIESKSEEPKSNKDIGVDGNNGRLANNDILSIDTLEIFKTSKFQVGDRIKCDFDEGEALGAVVSLDGVEDGVIYATIKFEDGTTESVYLDESIAKLPDDIEFAPTFDISKEKYLEEEICRLINYGLIFNGELEIYKQPGVPYGQQFPTDVGRIDLLCRNKKSNSFVVIEIKRGKSADQVIGQISRYMGYVKKKVAKPDQSVEGIIVTYGPDKKLEYAVSIHDKIRVFTYSVNITEWQDEE